jgi:hypothetical protein
LPTSPCIQQRLSGAHTADLNHSGSIESLIRIKSD